jgi:hypothetical protein
MARNIRRGPIPSDIGDLIDQLDDIERRLSTLEAPSGEALANTVAQLQALVADIQTQLDNYLATRYTNAQIDAKDQAITNALQPQIDGKAPAVHGHDQSQVSGTWTKGVSTGDPVFFTNAYNTDLTGTRRTAWLQSDGRLGYASSSRAKKTDIQPLALDPAAVLKLEPKSFIYRAELTKRTNARANGEPDYPIAREVGLIAEDLVDAGLSAFVIYDADGKVEGIEYSMLVVALLTVARAQDKRITDLDGRLRKLEQSPVLLRLGL